MKEIQIITFCDYPNCSDEAREEEPQGQETTGVDFWFNARGRGRRTQAILIELCADHLAELRGLYNALARYDQKEEDEEQ